MELSREGATLDSTENPEDVPMLKPFVITLALLPGPALAQPFSFAVLGDMPYGPAEETYTPFSSLIDAINASGPDLVIHVGDTKSGGSPCTDAVLAEQLAFLNRFDAPVLYTPGDNEWTDCHTRRAGGHDPRERLARIRSTYFAMPEQSLGARPIAVESQSARGYPENVRLMMHDIAFITAHVVGSNNGFEAQTLATAEEFFARDAANRDWLAEGFAAAQEAEARAVVLAIHGDMFEFDFGLPWNAEGFLRHSGFARFADVLTAEANSFGRPVLLIFGDSHVFRVFQPFPETAPGIMALETFGAENMHAVRVQVTPEADYPFAIAPIFNPAQPLVPAR